MDVKPLPVERHPRRRIGRPRRRLMWLWLTLALVCAGFGGATYTETCRHWTIRGGDGSISIDGYKGVLVLLWERLVWPDPAQSAAVPAGAWVRATSEQADYVGLLIRVECNDWPLWRPDFELHAKCGAMSLPLWIPTALFLAAAARSWWRARRFPPGRCHRCGYDLTGNVSSRCPECGARTESR